MSDTFPNELKALLNARAYPHPTDSVTLLETHISWVLLAGKFAYKIKRPVCLAFVDQRSLERRHFLCLEELRLNRRFAPTLYLEVVGITLRSGEARIGGTGHAVEYAVRMRRFDRAQELDQLLANRGIEPVELARFGRRVAQLHARLPQASSTNSWGNPAAVRELILGNFEETLRAAGPIGSAREVEALRAPLSHKLDSSEAWLRQRREAGFVREAHGDLHSRNIARVDGELLAFDCLEFEPSFRWIDVADETSLLIVDLEARGWPLHAHAFWSGYLDQSGDYGGHRVLDLYKAHRALVRAKVAALTMGRSTASEDQMLLEEYRALLRSAGLALAPREALLLMIGGVSGSGKTWLARHLAPALQMTHVRSDVERKRLGGLDLSARSDSNLGQNLYSPVMNDAVYARLCECAEAILSGGHIALIDATFSRRATRRRFVALAARLGVRVAMIHCQAELPILRARLAERGRIGRDVSEADERVLDWQLQRFEPGEPDEGMEIIEVDTTRPDAVACAEAQIRKAFLA